MLEERRSMEEKIIQKAWRDPEFKKRLLADPNAAISAELGVAVPAGVTVKVVEETADTGYLVLPRNPDDMQLSDAELSGVAGGGANSNVGCVTSYC